MIHIERYDLILHPMEKYRVLRFHIAQYKLVYSACSALQFQL